LKAKAKNKTKQSDLFCFIINNIINFSSIIICNLFLRTIFYNYNNSFCYIYLYKRTETIKIFKSKGTHIIWILSFHFFLKTNQTKNCLHKTRKVKLSLIEIIFTMMKMIKGHYIIMQTIETFAQIYYKQYMIYIYI
jgi:hypothetical protein